MTFDIRLSTLLDDAESFLSHYQAKKMKFRRVEVGVKIDQKRNKITDKGWDEVAKNFHVYIFIRYKMMRETSVSSRVLGKDKQLFIASSVIVKRCPKGVNQTPEKIDWGPVD